MHAGRERRPGRPAQGLSRVTPDGLGERSLLSVIEALPEEMVGAAFAERWGPITGVLVKLLSPAGQVPLHAHPTRAWAAEHLGSRFGKTEAWILLDTPGDGTEPAYAGIGFREDVDRDAFVDAVRRRDARAVRDSLHRTPIARGEVYVAHGGVPHYLGPRISFIEVQEPSDHLVIPEWSDADDAGATMGLGFDIALGMLDFEGTPREATLGRARQRPEVIARPPVAPRPASRGRSSRLLRRHAAGCHRGAGGRRWAVLDRDRDRRRRFARWGLRARPALPAG